MRKNNSKRNIIFIIIIMLIISFSIVFVQYKDNNKPKANLVISSKQSNIIKITDKLPLIDNVGKNIIYNKDNMSVQGYYSFIVKNNSNFDTNFEIYLDDSKYENTIHPNFIKTYLTDSNDNPVSGFDGLAVPTYYKLRVSNIVPTGRKIYEGNLKSFESKKYTLRAWVGDAYSIDVLSKSFSFDVKVEAK